MATTRLEKRVLALGRAIVRAFESTEAKIAAIVSVALSEHTTVRNYRTRQVEVTALLLALDSQVSREAPAVIEQAFDIGKQISDNERWTRKYEADQNFNAFDREAMRLLSDNLVNTLGEATQTVGRRTDDIFRRIGLRTTLETYAKGEVPSAFNAGALERRLREQGLTAFVDSIGRPWTLERYAKMAIHTVRSEAANQGIANRMLSRGFEIYKISNPEVGCKQCLPYIGHLWAFQEGVTLDGEPVPVADRIPPFHPQCECFLLPSEESVRRRREQFV